MRLLFLTEIALWKYRAQLPGFEMPKALILQQRQFDDRFALTLEIMADRLEGKSPQRPMFGNSALKLQESPQADTQKTDQAFSDQDSGLLFLRNRIQTLTSSLADEI